MNKKDSDIIDSLINAPPSGKMLSKDMGKFIENDCINGDGPPCQDRCPINLDILAFFTKLQRKNFNSAFSIFRDHAIFPEIVCALCPAPCNDACVRKDVDQSLDMRKLERAVVDYARSTTPIKFNIPKKNQHVAIVGASLCGLACTIKLVSHGYDVTIFEKSDRIGGRLWDLLSPDIFMADIENQMQFIEYELCLNTEVKALDELSDFAAVLIATGEGDEAFGLLEGFNDKSLGSTKDGFFIAGGVIGADVMSSIEQGIRVARSIENYLKVGRMHEMMGINFRPPTRFKPDVRKIKPIAHVDAARYSKEDALKEASRCLKCDCSQCQDSCDFMQYYKKLPKKIANEVKTSFNPVEGLQARIATRLIGSCYACGLCKDVCPVDIDLGEFLLESRRIMHREGDFPPAWHDFWMRDMFFANGNRCRIAKNAPDKDSSEYVFFPGCQIGASDPDYVEKTYAYLRDKLPETGLIMQCCGAPAEWAGDEKSLVENMQQISEEWERMGKPKFIFACPTCEKMFRKYLPEIEQKSLYDVVVKEGLPENYSRGNNEILTVYDPCSSRYDESMQDSVRKITETAGYQVDNLEWGKEGARCCSYGGHIYPANISLAQQTAADRVQMSEHPYVTYCTNCRDIFATQDKPARHILDIIFGINEENRPAPSLTSRRHNRLILQKLLLEKVWSEEVSEVENDIKLTISPELTKKLNKLLIIEDDLINVIKHCEATGNKILEENTGNIIGHLRQGIITYWVIYKKNGDQYEVVNAYSHRMQIEGE
ncbi:MAG: pyridine nucleotide-disulfide oxidoreductase/dicluster-binding protein [Bacillota bacterium]|jgi:Fe-S oxidoreductase